jgi:hypothetical protein
MSRHIDAHARIYKFSGCTSADGKRRCTIGSGCAFSINGRQRCDNTARLRQPRAHHKYADVALSCRRADEILLPAMKAHIGEYEAMTAQIYAQHLSVEEMVTLSSFYRTSVGQKWVVLQPLIFQQTVSAGILWVEKVEDKVIEQHRAELLKRGIEK